MDQGKWVNCENFSEKKILTVDQLNMCWLVKTKEDFQGVYNTNYQTPTMVLSLVPFNGEKMPPFFFKNIHIEKCQKFCADNIARLWCKGICPPSSSD
uniref:Uncharacterized protein n=1 Tax=Lepeophtheirus salmonis TaxID=72036 RepID=A0A0K2UW47_LEPSM